MNKLQKSAWMNLDCVGIGGLIGITCSVFISQFIKSIAIIAQCKLEGENG